jgi:hypothetical protein
MQGKSQVLTNVRTWQKIRKSILNCMALHDIQDLRKSNNEKHIDHFAKDHKIVLELHA